MITIKDNLPRGIKGTLSTSGSNRDLDSKIADDENVQAGGFVFKTDNPKYMVGLKEGATSDDVLGVAVRTPYRTQNNPNGCNYYAKGTDVVITKSDDSVYVVMDTNSKEYDKVYVNPSTGVISSESSTVNRTNFLKKNGEEATPAVLIFPNISSYESWKTAKTGFFEFIVDGEHIKTYVDFSGVKSILDIANTFNNNRDLNTVLSIATTSDNLGLVFTTRSKGKDSNISLVDVNNPFDSFLLSIKEEDGTGGGLNPAQLSFFYEENDYYLDNYRSVVDGTITVLIGDQSIESAKLDFSRVNNLDDVVSEFNGDDNLRNLLTCEHVVEGNRHQIVFTLKKSTLGSKVTLKDWSNYKMLMALTGSKYNEHGADGSSNSITINVNSDILGGIKDITNGKVNFRLEDKFLFIENLDFSKISNIRDIANVFNSNEVFTSNLSCEMGNTSEDEYGAYIETIFKAKEQKKLDIVDLSSPMFDIFTRKKNEQGKEGISWNISNIPEREKWQSVAYGNGKFVTVAYNSNISAYSTDGITWTYSKLPSSATWTSITYGNGKFVAITFKSDKCSVSSDGINWTEGKLPSSADWCSVTYGNDKFVAIANNSEETVYSTDGITWTHSKLPSSASWCSVTYGNGKFVAIADTYEKYAYSTDGITWVESKLPYSANWQSITYGDGKFVAVTNGNKSAVSTDGGITWADGKLPSRNIWLSVTYGNGKFVAITYNSNISATSSDGINWTEGKLPSSAEWRSVTYGNDKFVAVAWNASKCAFGYDGINWTEKIIPGESYWASITFGNNKFVTVAYKNDKYATSDDGINWTDGKLPMNANWRSVTYGNGKFVAVATKSDKSAVSTDGVKWRTGIMPSSADWCSVTYGNDKFVAVSGSDNYIYAYSTDGITWVKGELPYHTNWQSITYGDGKFVAVSDNEGYVYSTDGITWTYSKLPSSATWTSITYGNGKFVTVAYNSNISAYSTDGITWVESKLPFSAEWRSVAYGNGKFVTVDHNKNDKYAYSTDGINWIEDKLPMNAYWNSITFGNNKFVVIAESKDKYVYSIVDGSTSNLSFSCSSLLDNWKNNSPLNIEVDSGTEQLTGLEDLSSVDSFETISNTLKTSFNDKFNFSFNSPKNDRLTISPNSEIKNFDLDFLNFSIKDNFTWIEGTLPSNSGWRSVTYGNGKFVAVTDSGTNRYAYSIDGINWTGGDFPNPYNWSSITYGNNKFVAIANNSEETVYSTDGITWESGTMPSNSEWQSITYGNGKFVAVAGNNATNKCAVSTDGITWESGTLPSSTNWTSITFGNNKFVAVAYSDKCAVSDDGKTWTLETMPSSANWSSVTYGNGRFVAVANVSKKSAYSVDGITWTLQILPLAASWYSITFGNGNFVAVADNTDKYIYSTDGITWESGTMPSNSEWQSITYGNGKFVAVANGNECAYSEVNAIASDPRSISKVLGWKNDTIENVIGSNPYANIPGFCNLKRIKTVNNGGISITVNDEKLEAKGLDFSNVTEETVSDVFSNNETLHGKVNVSLEFNESGNRESSMFRVWNDKTGSNESITDIRGSVNINDIIGNIIPVENKTGSISPKTPAVLTFPNALAGDSTIARWKTIVDGKLSLREDKTTIEMNNLDFSNINSINDILRAFEIALNDRLRVKITSDGYGLEFSTNSKGEGTTLVYIDSSDDVFENLGAVIYEEGTGGDEPVPGDVIDTGFTVVNGGKAGECVEIRRRNYKY